MATIRRLFKVSALVEVESETREEGEAQAKQTLSSLGIKVDSVEYVQRRRTLRQNDSLHLYFTLLANELNAHGLDMRTFIKQGVEIQWTPYSVKEYLWKATQKALFGTKSTTELDKSQEINAVYDAINRAVIERSKGEIQIPFPSLETLMDKQTNQPI